jgi:putative protease
MAPDISLLPLKKAERPPFPEGIYGAVSRIDDLFVLQSVRPIRAMLQLSRKNAARLLDSDKAPLPFRPGEIVLVLDPYFPQAVEAALEDEIPRLRALGYNQFVVNNLGHFAYFRTDTAGGSAGSAAGKADGSAAKPLKPAALIAGPYLYQFNRWANAFIASLGVDAIVSALENNRQNLERTVDAGRRAFTFITLFAYPALFRIRADLSEVYDFQEFRDSREEQFQLISAGGNTGPGGGDGSLVIPEQPFSTVDKLPFLEEAGFRRFILDFSGPPLRKKDFRDIMTALKAGQPLPDTSRFNWKNGFYSGQ